MSDFARIWIPAARPKTLPAAVAPVVMGVAIATRDGAFHAGAAAAALVGALLIQIASDPQPLLPAFPVGQWLKPLRDGLGFLQNRSGSRPA
mgnify:CR=1 FL=1